MAGSLASDSSKTLSAANNNTPHTAMNGTSSSLLVKALCNSQYEFLQPQQPLHSAALELAKKFLDPLAASVASKNNAVLDKIYLEGFDVDQVWEQARIVVDAVESGVSKGMGFAPVANGGEAANGKKRKASTFEEDTRSDVESQSETGSESDVSERFDGGSSGEETEEVSDESGGGVALLDEEDDLEYESAEEEEEEEVAGEFVEDVHGLNDGFFSIDDFNRQTQLLETQDQRGDGDSGDEIDYNVDPDQLEDEDEDGSDEGGYSPINLGKDDYKEDEDIDMQEEDGNANGLMYEDFFAPPPKKGPKKRPLNGAKPWNQRAKRSEEELETEHTNIEAEMARVRHDLLDDDMSDGGSGTDTHGDPSDPMSRRSTHEKRQAALTEQIRQLEAANVAKKEWTLSGEARAAARPLNSLLEEDLDFERAGKPVPVITQDVTEGLEDMIKRRIIAGDFDEVLRRRPDDISSKFRRGRVELDDSKPQEGLAEIYEKEHLRKTDPENNPEVNDAKLEQEHREIEALFLDVSRKLDALTSWHFTPKPPKPSISIVADAPAISIEEARPTAAAGGSLTANSSMLAPQEVYAPQKDKAVLPIGEGGGREIVGKSGAPVSTREMTRDQKQRRRRKEKLKIKKKNIRDGNQGGEVKEGSKKDVIDKLRRGGVQVIGKGGETRDIDGHVVNGAKGGSKSNFLKL